MVKIMVKLFGMPQKKGGINLVKNDYMQMNLIYFTCNYLCLWGEEIKRSSLEPFPLSSSRRTGPAFVYNVIHVGYFEDDVLRGYHGDTADTNKQNPRHKTKM